MKKKQIRVASKLAAIIAIVFVIWILGTGIFRGTGWIPESTSGQPWKQIAAAIETEPVPSTGDAADDPAVWVHPTKPSRSTIIGTDKKGGLAVYDLVGKQLQYVSDGRMNNVDVRQNFPLRGKSIALVTTGNRSSNTIAIYQVNPASRLLEDVAARTIHAGTLLYGSCMYVSPISGRYYVFITFKGGKIKQWELFENANGEVEGRLARSFAVGSTAEGCVADDELGYVYIGEQEVGIWKFPAEPGTEATPLLVDTTGPRGHLISQVEGLAIYYESSGSGYLIASSQGNDTFVIYCRERGNDYVTTFEIVDRNDSVTHTDGIEAVSANLGQVFPKGIFIAQDHENDTGNQNFKIVSWQEIENVLNTQQNKGLKGLLSDFLSFDIFAGSEIGDYLKYRLFNLNKSC